MAIGVLACSREAAALDVGTFQKKPVRLDVTETTVLSQQFDPRTSEGQRLVDHGYGAWINRLNLALRWDRWTAGLRLDSSLYWRRPGDLPDCGRGESPPGCVPAGSRAQVLNDTAARYQNSLVPAKMWVTYAAPGLEATLGDAYVQFGRGLVLSMRKLDDLGIDSTVRGAKVQWQKDPFAMTVVAGFANPARIDEQTATALFPRRALPGDNLGEQPVYGSDRIVAAQLQAGRGLPLTLSTHAVRITRCAPWHYDARGRIDQGDAGAALFGSCDPADTSRWLGSIQGVAATASEIDMAGQVFEIPSLWGHGKLYVEGALQRRRYDQPARPGDEVAHGNALYGALTVTAGRLLNTLEVKSYRNFFPASGAVDATRASALATLSYSLPPTGELITQDNFYGSFNTCVDGARLRSDVRVKDGLVLYGQGVYAYTRGEIIGGGCDAYGRTTSPANVPAARVQAEVWDGLVGVEHLFDQNRSQVFVSAGARENERVSGEFLYRDNGVRYTVTKWISGPYSVELTGWHRRRREDSANRRAPAYEPEWWVQGEHYTAFKVAPKWVFSQGIEYTTQLGFPTLYLNAFALYRFTSESNVRLFVGQQRGGLRCVSGVCRIFPAFEGVRADLTLRF